MQIIVKTSSKLIGLEISGSAFNDIGESSGDRATVVSQCTPRGAWERGMGLGGPPESLELQEEQLSGSCQEDITCLTYSRSQTRARLVRAAVVGLILRGAALHVGRAG